MSNVLPVAIVLLCIAAETAGAHKIAEYRWERIDNGNAADETGKWPGRVVGEVKYSAGKAGQALQLDGRGHVTIPGSEKWTFEQGLSIEAWIAPERLVAGRIVDRSTPASSDSFCLDTHPGDSIRLITPAGTISTPKALTAGRWTHIIAVWDPQAGELAIYLDGKLAACSPAGRAAAMAGPNSVHIGADPAGGNRFVGKIDEVRIYDVALGNEAVSARFAGKEPVIQSTDETPGPVLYRDGPQVEYSRLLARNDVVYLSPAVHEHEALPVGNGRLCAMVWNGDGLNLQLNHANRTWHQNSSGRVHLRTQPGLLDQVQEFDERLSLHDGTVRVRCRSAAGQWQATVAALDGLDVIAVHIEGQLRSPELRLDLEQWRPTATALAGDTVGFEESLLVPSHPDFSRKTALVARADCPATVAAPRRDGESHVLTLVLSPKREADGSVKATVYIANPVVAADADPKAAATKALEEALQAGWKQHSERNAGRWSRFWEKSFVWLRSPEGTADYMENLWYLHLYWMACGGEGDLAVKFNGGPFLVHRDSRSWGTSYWYQNTRELYWPLPAANHLELCRGLERLYLGTRPAHRKLARELFGKRGLQVQETMAVTGDGDKWGNPYTMLYLSTGLETALQLYRQAVFARDDDLLRRDVLPFIQEAVEFYVDYATVGADGRYHIVPEDARETYWRAQDSMTSIAALRTAIPVLLRESERLALYAELRPKWNAFLERLAPLPERPDGKTYAPCVVPPEIPASDNATVNRLYPRDNTSTSLEKRFNSENVELDVVYPFGLAGMDTENREKAIAAFHTRVFKGSYGWDWSPICAARLGMADEAAGLQAEHCRNTQHWPQGFWDSPSGPYWAGGLVDCPYFDSSGVNAAATSEMLLQSYDGRLRVWPSVPACWTGAFRLRAESGFMVTSERSGGQVRYVAVESLFGEGAGGGDGNRCRLVNPWPDGWRVLSAGKLVVEGDQKEIHFPAERGRLYLVERASAPVAQMQFQRLAPAPNQDVKYLASSRRVRLTVSAAARPPMLGITRDGQSGPRIAAAANRVRAAEAIRAVVGQRPALQGVKAQWLDSQDKPSAAAWLCDSVLGAGSIPIPRASASGYLLELPAAGKVTAVVWSYDRMGQRQDGNRQVREVLVETSADGRDWKQAARRPVPPSWLAGHAESLDPPADGRFVRLKFFDAANKPAVCACDEIEVY